MLEKDIFVTLMLLDEGLRKKVKRLLQMMQLEKSVPLFIINLASGVIM